MNNNNLSRIKTILNITDDSKDTQMDIISSGVLNDYQTISGRVFNKWDEDNDLLPSGCEFPVALMIGYKLSMMNSLGVNQDKLADSSTTYESTGIGYPDSVIGMIAKHIRIK